MSSTTNLRLPYLDANQNQKTVTHNAALTALDALVNCQVQDTALAAPPSSPADGQCWIVASGGTGAWAGRDLQVAAWQDGAWSFYPPNRGTLAYSDASSALLVWSGSAWVQVQGSGSGSSQQLSQLGIGTAPDTNNPLSVKGNSALFASVPTGSGGTGDVRLTLSKSAQVRTASLLFQDAFSGRAEVGLTGDDDFHFKVSPDGSTFYDAIQVTASSGTVAFLNTPTAPTPSTADNSAQLATTAFVKAQGYLSAAPVTSVAGRAGTVTLAVADVGGAAPLASPAFTGTPTAPTPAAGTNTTQVATAAFVLGQAATAAPLADGTAAVGTSLLFARQDHVHPTDATRAPLASPALTGSPTAPTAAQNSNSTLLATAAYADRAAAANLIRTAVSDAAYTVLPTDRTVAVTALTAARTLTLPAASAYPAGTTLTVMDESGACSATSTITLAPAGANTINGASSAVLSAPYAYLALQGNGSNRWTVTDSGNYALTPVKPAFSAYGPTNPSSYPGELTFQTKLSDRNTNFSTATGRFTAPVPGLYSITVCALIDSSSSSGEAVSIRKNGAAFNGRQTYFTNPGSAFIQVTASVVIQLAAGDYVSVFTAVKLYAANEGLTTISGFLLA